MQISLIKIEKFKKILLFLIFLSLPLGYFGRINFSNVFIGVYYWDIFLCIYILISTLIFVKNFRSYKIFFPTFYKTITIFIIYALVTTLNAYRYLDSISELIISSLYLLRFTVYSLAGALVFIDLKNKYINPGFIKKLIIGEGLLIAIIGFLQLIFIPDFTLLDKSLMWDPHQNRLTGLYFDPNFAGIILVLILTLLTSDILNIFESKKINRIGIIKILIFSIIFLAIILTFSRSAWLAFAIIVLIIGLIKYKWIIPLALIGIFLVYYAVPRVQTRITGITDPADSFYLRLVSWTETYEIAKQNPVIGYGFNTFRYIRQNMGFIKYDEGIGDRSDSGSDSSLLFVWVTTGLIGLTIFLIAHLKLLFLSLKNALNSNLSLVFTALQIGLLINSQFINSLFFPVISVNLALFTALFLAEVESD